MHVCLVVDYMYLFTIPCTLRKTGSLYRSSPLRKATAHVTFVLLYFSVAGTDRENVRPTCVAVISGAFISDNKESLTIQATVPVVRLQLKVAVDPSVELTDVGVLIKAGKVTENVQ